jgi:hypothetical protein
MQILMAVDHNKRDVPFHLAATGVILLILLADLPCPASDWPEVRRAEPFIYRADFPLAKVESCLQGLAGLQEECTRTLGLPRPKAPIEVYLFHDEATYRRYLQKLYPRIPFRQALYIKQNGVGRLFAYAGPQFEVDVRHEAVHALLHAALAGVPLWLDEGLATYFELPPAKRERENPYLSSVQWNLRLGLAPDLERLESLGDTAVLSKGDYRDCWAWVHFLLNGRPAAREELLGYLRNLQTSPPPGPLSRHLARRVPEIRQQLKTHLLAIGKTPKSG